MRSVVLLDQSTITTTQLLTWSGLLPFAAICVLAIIGAPDWLEQLLIAYGALILSFMAGTLWTRHLLGERTHPRMLIASNVLVLAAWPAVLMPLAWAACWLGLLFTAHLLLEEPWRGYGLPSWYRRLRLAVSLSAISLLLIGGLVGIGMTAQ
ncbi:MAG: DUF3429 domain-containing protein [Wenzhouxiangella sp.]